MKILTFKTLREANEARLPLFKNKLGEIAHSKEDGSDWNIDQWFQAVLGELGEYANLRKKYERGDMNFGEFKSEAAKELADVLIYTDILAKQINLEFPWDTFQSLMTTVKTCNYSFGEDAHNVLIKNCTVSLAMAWNYCHIHHADMHSEKGILAFVVDLFYLAACIEIDLQEAVVRKFNEVSHRVGAAVLIDFDDKDQSYVRCEIL